MRKEGRNCHVALMGIHSYEFAHCFQLVYVLAEAFGINLSTIGSESAQGKFSADLVHELIAADPRINSFRWESCTNVDTELLTRYRRKTLSWPRSRFIDEPFRRFLTVGLHVPSQSET
jgi:hypothetical protein